LESSRFESRSKGFRGFPQFSRTISTFICDMTALCHIFSITYFYQIIDAAESELRSNFTKIHPVAAELMHADCHDEANMHFSPFTRKAYKVLSKWRSTEVGLFTSNKCSTITVYRRYDGCYQLTSTYSSSQGHIHGI
jgi:hypothetical protein